MSQTLQERIARALATIINPRTGTDVVTGEMIRDIATTTGGKVRMTMLLSPRTSFATSARRSKGSTVWSRCAWT